MRSMTVGLPIGGGILDVLFFLKRSDEVGERISFGFDLLLGWIFSRSSGWGHRGKGWGVDSNQGPSGLFFLLADPFVFTLIPR